MEGKELKNDSVSDNAYVTWESTLLEMCTLYVWHLIYLSLVAPLGSGDIIPWNKVIVNLIMGEDVTSSLKNLNPEILGNYCLVSNLSFIMKVIEMVVRELLQNIINEMDYVDTYQYGFEPEHGSGESFGMIVDILFKECTYTSTFKPHSGFQYHHPWSPSGST